MLEDCRPAAIKKKSHDQLLIEFRLYAISEQFNHAAVRGVSRGTSQLLQGGGTRIMEGENEKGRGRFIKRKNAG